MEIRGWGKGLVRSVYDKNCMWRGVLKGSWRPLGRLWRGLKFTPRSYLLPLAVLLQDTQDDLNSSGAPGVVLRFENHSASYIYHL
jgi:hypothetical protein